jgi:hypothetical protein
MRNPLVALAVTAERSAAELAAELTCEDVLAVQEWLLTDEAAAADWLYAHEAEIDWLACAPPSRRRSRASLRGDSRPRLLYWAVARLTRGARVARALAGVPLPEVASYDRALAGGALSLLDAAGRLPEVLEQPCWNEHGEFWP